MKEAEIDFLVTSVNEEFLDRCDKAGVGVISTGYNLPFYVMTGDTTPWQTFDYGTYKDHECLWGDNLMDEPFDCMFTELGQTVNNEVAPFKELYADFDHIGTFLTNGGRATGTNSGYLTPMTEENGCNVFTTAPVLTGCFKKEDARAYVFVNMFSPDNGKSAKLCVTFDDAEKITVYRKENVIRTEGNTLNLTLENNEGVFVTVE